MGRILDQKGFIYTTGIGKSGMVAQRFSAALSSVSCPSRFIHGTEWFHGDLGLIRDIDMVGFIRVRVRLGLAWASFMTPSCSDI